MKPLNRRTFLRGSGCLLPLPFLHLMEASPKKRQTPSSPPLRFMALFKPNGVHPPSWNISGGTEHDYKLSYLMKPFEKHKKDLLILDNMGDLGFSTHYDETRRYLSGHHENTQGASIDQLIADKIGKSCPVRSLELTTEGLYIDQINCSYISYDKKGRPIPRNSDAQLVFDQLFRNPMSDPAKRRQMGSLLDRVSDDVRALKKKAGKEDRDILEEYMTVVRETEQRLENVPKPVVAKTDFSKLQRPEHGKNLDEQVNIMLDLLALALWTDSTRCASYMLGNSNSRQIFDFLDIPEQHHYLSHFFRNFSRPNLEGLLKINLWHMEKFNYLLNRMKSYRDHHGSLLDHSIVLFGGGMGHSDNHTVTRVPTILAGQGGGLLKTGRYVRYAEKQSLARLHLALLNGFGVRTNSYAGATSPLPGLKDSGFKAFKEPQFESWLKKETDQIEVQGRLRMSSNLNEAKIFYIDIEKPKKPVKIDVPFADFHNFNIAYHSGAPVRIVGKGSSASGQTIVKKIISITPLFGEKPKTTGPGANPKQKK